MARLRKLTREQIITTARKAARDGTLLIWSSDPNHVDFQNWPDLIRHLLAVIDGKIGDAP